MAKCKYTGQFGKLVIGQEQVDAEVRLTEGAKDIYGKLVTGKHPATAETPGETIDRVLPDPVVEAEEVEEADESLSVRAIKAALKETSAPAVLDNLARDEFMRPEGARKSVLAILLAKEKAREEPKPRPEAMEALQSKLEELEG